MSWSLCTLACHCKPLRPGWLQLSARSAEVQAQFGFLSTMMTLSPLKKSLLMKRSLLTGCEALLPLPVFGICMACHEVSMTRASCAGSAWLQAYL